MLGVDVRRDWPERELVGSFAGGQFPGTPDGMYEDWEGRISCVQVVRVPLVAEMSAAEMEDVFYHTVLTKIWKSQVWMQRRHTLPHEFIIFCWMPRQTPEGTGERAQALVERLRHQGWPFRLRAKMPADPGALFPSRFAWRGTCREGGCEGYRPRKHAISEDDLSTMDPGTLCCEEEEPEPQLDLFAEWPCADGADAPGGPGRRGCPE